MHHHHAVVVTHLPIPRVYQLRRYVGAPLVSRWLWTGVRSVATPATPAAPAAPPPPASQPTHTSTAGTNSLEQKDKHAQLQSFEAAFHDALADVVRSSDVWPSSSLRETTAERDAASHLSPEMQYLVGLRADYPVREHRASHNTDALTAATAAAAGATSSLRPMRDASDRPPAAGADSVFLHHVFNNAKEAALYVFVRQPSTFLSAERETPPAEVQAFRSDGGRDTQWPLLPSSKMLPEMEAALLGMTEYATKHAAVKPGSNSNGSVLPFWRAMLEQAFLAQYCDVSVLRSGGRDVRCIYPFSYSAQPEELRRRLERGIRALLCASAFTLHAQWEQYMARHRPTDTTAHVLGLEFVMLWWYANPDQMPVELTSHVVRLPPPTSRQQQRLSAEDAVGRSMTAPGDWVEYHLLEYVDTHLTVDPRNCTNKRNAAAASEAGGFLCASAVFPRSYCAALRAHLAKLQRTKSFVSCPLLVRVLEVAIAVASNSWPQSWNGKTDLHSAPSSSLPSTSVTQPLRQLSSTTVHDNSGERGSTPTHRGALECAAARRGRQVATQLVHDWLWPVVCEDGAGAPSLMPTVHDLLAPAAASWSRDGEGDKAPLFSGAVRTSGQATESHSPAASSPGYPETSADWAVLLAAVTAIAQIRRHLLDLRRSGKEKRRARDRSSEDTAGAAAREICTLMDIHDRLFSPAMQALLIHPVAETEAGETAVSTNQLSAAPDWSRLVFARVAHCFQESGWLQSDAARQPATPARLWHLLYHTLCDAFPNVFHGGNTVTVLWTLYAIEGVGAVPSSYFSTYRPIDAGRLEAMQMWVSLLARSGRALRSSAEQLKGVAQSGGAEPDVTDAVRTLERHMLAAPDRFCPRTERRQRAAHIPAASASSLAAEEHVHNAAAPLGTASDARSHRAVVRRHDRHTASGSTAAVSFASSCSPATPLHLNSEEAIVQMQAHLAACDELNREAMSVLLQLFRRYATLPLLRTSSVRDGTPVMHDRAELASSVVPVEESALLRRLGQPSILVLLQLLHALNKCGDTRPEVFPHGKVIGAAAEECHGLVATLLRDVLPVCHTVVASYLHRLLLYGITLSGRRGALALLHSEELQSQLNQLPPSLGRRRLIAAFLWSGLPASALSEDESAGSESGTASTSTSSGGCTFGSGSLAWHVMRSSQLHFFSYRAAAVRAAPMQVNDSMCAEESKAAPETAPANTRGAVTVLAVEVLQHLRQLADAIPEPVRTSVYLRPFLTSTIANAKDTGEAGKVDTASGLEAAVASNEDEVGEVDSQPTQLRFGESSQNWHDAVDDIDTAAANGAGSDTLHDGRGERTSAAVNDDDDEFGTPTDWTGNASEQLFEDAEDGRADLAALHDAGVADAAVSSLWNAEQTLGAPTTAKQATQDTRDTERRPQQHATRQQKKSTAQCLLGAALQPSLEPARHIFFSALEVLAWMTCPRACEASDCEEADVPETNPHNPWRSVGSPNWCAELDAHYSTCAAVWEARLGLRQGDSTVCAWTNCAGTVAGEGAAVLLQSKVMLHTALVLLATCPDVYLLSLLLMAWIARWTDDAFAAPSALQTLQHQIRRATSLFPWTVDCALAQMLFHAGITASKVRAWRSSTAVSLLADEDKSLSSPLVCAEVHHALLRQLQSARSIEHSASAQEDGQDEEDEVPLLAAGVASPPPHLHDQHRCLLMSMGSLLLASLEMRRLYRYNYYINEFLQSKLPTDTRSDITDMRVVLPSVQLIAPTPLASPPQQLKSLRQAWRYGSCGTTQRRLRDGFRHMPAQLHHEQAGVYPGEPARAARQTLHDQQHTAMTEDEEYVKAFLL